MLFGNGEPANSFMPPQVPYYDQDSPGLQYDMDKAKEELAQSSVPDGFAFELLGRIRRRHADRRSRRSCRSR